MKIIRIKIDDTMNEISVDLKKSTVLKKLNHLAISKGSSQIRELYSWTYQSKQLTCYGWYDGDSGFENKHELLPNGISNFLEQESSEILLFGDIFLVCLKNKKYIDIDVSEYSEIYEFICGGFDDCNSSDESNLSDESNEEDYDDDEKINTTFIIHDKENDSDESYVDNDEECELDEDLNDYD